MVAKKVLISTEIATAVCFINLQWFLSHMTFQSETFIVIVVFQVFLEVTEKAWTEI